MQGHVIVPKRPPGPLLFGGEGGANTAQYSSVWSSFPAISMQVQSPSYSVNNWQPTLAAQADSFLRVGCTLWTRQWSPWHQNIQTFGLLDSAIDTDDIVLIEYESEIIRLQLVQSPMPKYRILCSLHPTCTYIIICTSVRAYSLVVLYVTRIMVL